MARKPARPHWLLIDDETTRRALVKKLVPVDVQTNRSKLAYHDVPDDVAIAGVQFAESDLPDPNQEAWYNCRWRSPRGLLHIVYFIEVRNDGTKVLKIFDAYPVGREHY
jgi:hypothetical protein